MQNNTTKKNRLAILGSTGSIGTQGLDVVAAHPELFEVEVLSAHSNHELLIKQAQQFVPNAVVCTDEKNYAIVKDALSGLPIKVFSGMDALNEVVQWDTVDTVLTAIVGFAGLQSTIAAVNAGKKIALANKETLVVAGDIVMALAAEKRASIVPVDSEHSAIYQCLVGEHWGKIEKIILTASGGPFLGRKPNYLVNVKASHALQHPNWTMGAKITIDSATLMNKGLEMIEANSLVQFIDGSLKAQMGLPDMKLPIQYALAYPQRISNDFKRFDFKDFAKLTFEAPDYKTFRNLALAKDAMYKGGNLPCIMNAANEVVVHSFLQNKVSFIEMSDIIEKVMERVTFIEQATLEDYMESDSQARIYAAELVKTSQLSY
jgi:1-deoxy-D-xylulose-5-phosphate reductoisomerase